MLYVLRRCAFKIHALDFASVHTPCVEVYGQLQTLPYKVVGVG